MILLIKTKKEWALTSPLFFCLMVAQKSFSYVSYGTGESGSGYELVFVFFRRILPLKTNDLLLLISVLIYVGIITLPPFLHTLINSSTALYGSSRRCLTLLATTLSKVSSLALIDIIFAFLKTILLHSEQFFPARFIIFTDISVAKSLLHFWATGLLIEPVPQAHSSTTSQA